MAYDVQEFETGWAYRFPSGDEKAKWVGFFPTRKAAEDAGLKACEQFLAKSVAQALGLN